MSISVPVYFAEMLREISVDEAQSEDFVTFDEAVHIFSEAVANINVLSNSSFELDDFTLAPTLNQFLNNSIKWKALTSGVIRISLTKNITESGELSVIDRLFIAEWVFELLFLVTIAYIRYSAKTLPN